MFEYQNTLLASSLDISYIILVENPLTQPEKVRGTYIVSMYQYCLPGSRPVKELKIGRLEGNSWREISFGFEWLQEGFSEEQAIEHLHQILSATRY